MKPFYVFLPVLLLAGLLPGCFENPLFDDGDYHDDEDPPRLSPPSVWGSAAMTSGAWVTRIGGIMNVSVRASNAGGGETAYDIQGQIIITDGPADIGSASISLGNLDAGQWTEAFVSIPINSSPSSATTLRLELTWWDWDGNVYQRRVNGSMFLKTS